MTESLVRTTGAGEGIALPPPRMNGGRPLMEALRERRSTRAFSERPLGTQLISDLLWAAFGANRSDGHRTAPSAHDWREIEVYSAMSGGLYRFDAAKGRLDLVLAEDIRAHTGLQDFVATAPLNLIFVANFAKMTDAAAHEKEFYAATDAGCICQNVYLYCASAGLATVVRGLIDRPDLARRMRLASTERIILAQSVGYPAA